MARAVTVQAGVGRRARRRLKSANAPPATHPATGDVSLEAAERALIAKLPPFVGLDAPALETLLAEARVQRMAEGADFFAQGGDAHSFFILVQGRVKVSQVTGDGQQVVVLIVGPGEFFGLAAAMGRRTYPGSATAAVDSTALLWPSAAWDRLAARHPTLARETMLTMGRRMDEMHARLREVSTQRVEQRIAHALLRLIRQSGRAVPDGVMIDFPITRQDISEMTGTTLHTVSRTLAGWEQSGILDGGRRRIVVRDAHALVRLCGE